MPVQKSLETYWMFHVSITMSFGNPFSCFPGGQAKSDSKYITKNEFLQCMIISERCMYTWLEEKIY